MKKILSYIMLLLMLLVTVHPVVGMHFCGGQLHNFHLYDIETDHSCCHVEVVVEPTVCCSAEAESEPMQVQFDSNCCSFETAAMETDAYQTQPQVQLNDKLLPVAIVSLLLNISEVPLIPETNSHLLKYSFPPSGRFLADLDPVSLICVNIN